MRGDFNNSPSWLEGLGPNGWSTQETADRIARGLKERTGREWDVTLCDRGHGPTGGFYIAPPKDRLVKGVMDCDDRRALKKLFEAILQPRDWRWYILPDETSTAIRILETGSARRTRASQEETSPDP